jgi:glycosyltransferase involved in cell wall biosynthesis
MKVTVVMAVRNGSPYLTECLDSVLAQSLRDFEFLIVDDASTDDTPAVLDAYRRRDPRIRLLTNESRLGPYPSVNRALRCAQGDAIARHDADDISPPDRLAIQFAALSSAADVTLVTGAFEVFGEPAAKARTIVAPPRWQPRLEWDLLFDNAVGAGGHVMFPRVIGGVPVVYPETESLAEDYELWCRLAQLGRVVCPREVVYRYRRHARAIGIGRRSEQASCVARIRRRVQQPYWPADAEPERIDATSRFWRRDGNLPLTGRVRDAYSDLLALRSGFLGAIDRRYSPAEREAVTAEIDRELSARLGYWLFRAIRFRDRASCTEVLGFARDKRDLGGVVAATLGHVTGAATTKIGRLLLRHDPVPRNRAVQKDDRVTTAS